MNNEKANEKPFYYCNIAQADMSLNDFRIGFGVKKNTQEPLKDEDIDFYMYTSPQHLKSLVILLTDHLRMYETLFGEIRLEPSEEGKKELERRIEIVRKP